MQQNPNLARILGDLAGILTPAKPQEWSLDKLFGAPQKRLLYYKKLYSRLLKTTSPGRSDHRLLVGANETLDRLIATCEERRGILIGDPSDHDIAPEAESPPASESLQRNASQATVQPLEPPTNVNNGPNPPSPFQLPPLSFHGDDHPVPDRSYSTDAPTVVPEREREAVTIESREASDSVAPLRVQSPEIAQLSNAFRKPVDGERVSSSTMGSRIDSGAMSVSR